MINDILNERQKTHGDFATHAEITQKLKNVARLGQWNKLDSMQRESVDMILHKLGRILNGNPNVKDHWTDIAGYATLIERTFDKEVKPDPVTMTIPDSLSGAKEFYDEKRAKENICNWCHKEISGLVCFVGTYSYHPLCNSERKTLWGQKATENVEVSSGSIKLKTDKEKLDKVKELTDEAVGKLMAKEEEPHGAYLEKHCLFCKKELRDDEWVHNNGVFKCHTKCYEAKYNV